MAENEMAGAGITAKERLERIENMLSDMSRQLDVRFLNVEHRIATLETAAAVAAASAGVISSAESIFHEKMEKDLAEAKSHLAESEGKMDARVNHIDEQQEALLIRQKVNSRLLAAVVIAAQVIEAIIYIVYRGH